MAIYRVTLKQCFLSLLALWRYRMADKTIVLRRHPERPLKIRDRKPLQLLTTHAECPQLICVRLGDSCFHVVLKKDTLELLSPVINLFLKDHANIVSFLLRIVV